MKAVLTALAVFLLVAWAPAQVSMGNPLSELMDGSLNVDDPSQVVDDNGNGSVVIENQFGVDIVIELWIGLDFYSSVGVPANTAPSSFFHNQAPGAYEIWGYDAANPGTRYFLGFMEAH